MIDWLVNRLFWWTPLRNAIFAEVHMYDRIGEIMNDPEVIEAGTSFYPNIDGWRAWSQDKELNKYYFNDIPEKSIIDAFSEIELMRTRSQQLEFDMDETW